MFGYKGTVEDLKPWATPSILDPVQKKQIKWQPQNNYFLVLKILLQTVVQKTRYPADEA